MSVSAHRWTRTDSVAVDETVIRLNNDQYWLFAAVGPETNELLHTELEPTTINVLAHKFLAELREKHDVDDVSRNLRFLMCELDLCLVNAVFLIDGSHSLKDACSRYGLDLRVERNRVAKVSKMSFET
jgi:transposase-like protein